MSQMTFNWIYVDVGERGGGFWQYVDMNYATAHNATSSQFMNIPGSDLVIYHSFNAAGSTYFIARAGVIFNCQSLPHNANITGATIHFYDEGVVYDRSWDLTVVKGDFTYPNPVSTDYSALLDETTSLGLISASDITALAYNDITLNSTGIAEISKTSYTKFAFRNSNDINNNPPSNGTVNESTEIGHDQLATGVQLIVDYTSRKDIDII